ncbi:hypothetical protein ACFFS2_40515 [Streptomyces aurantiacus]|uniref:Uncharacterized protein n=1 Tax=Streptomyces aurantiacus TaxID=47760 RepID=A0A7G1NW30_9ACTN|nr:hypothetical protein [Streptomyces aurantiacus]MDQ0773655.1 hypothetical protein [Streptomyces aurantiacus]BCL26842.1 hypothetical protein GCM10017557_17010 [Streptomyces aurantiacus]
MFLPAAGYQYNPAYGYFQNPAGDPDVVVAAWRAAVFTGDEH